MGDCIGIKTRKPVMARDKEEAPVRHEVLTFDPLTEKLRLRMQDMDDEELKDLFRYVMKLKNKRRAKAVAE